MQVNFVNNFSNKANPSFSGYKNIVSNTVTEDFCRISYMAMELSVQFSRSVISDSL